MKKEAFHTILLVMALYSSAAKADESPVSLAALAAAFRFPVSELITQNVTEDDRKVNGNAVVSTYQISSKTPFAFYPVLITVAREGTFITNETRQVLNRLDSEPEGLISKGGRGPLGNLPLGDDISGGLLIGEIRVSPTRQPFDRPEMRMAVFSTANIPSKQLDIRIAMLAAFQGGKDLIMVPGGESYYQAFSDPSDDKNYAEPPPRPEFDVRGLFTVLTELVRKSPLVANAKGIDSSAKAAAPTTSPPSTATPETSPLPTTRVAQTPTPTIESRAPVWPWGVGIAALAVVSLLFWKRRG